MALDTFESIDDLTALGSLLVPLVLERVQEGGQAHLHGAHSIEQTSGDCVDTAADSQGLFDARHSAVELRHRPLLVTNQLGDLIDQALRSPFAWSIASRRILACGGVVVAVVVCGRRRSWWRRHTRLWRRRRLQVRLLLLLWLWLRLLHHLHWPDRLRSADV